MNLPSPTPRIAYRRERVDRGRVEELFGKFNGLNYQSQYVLLMVYQSDTIKHSELILCIQERFESQISFGEYPHNYITQLVDEGMLIPCDLDEHTDKNPKDTEYSVSREWVDFLNGLIEVFTDPQLLAISTAISSQNI